MIPGMLRVNDSVEEYSVLKAFSAVDVSSVLQTGTHDEIIEVNFYRLPVLGNINIIILYICCGLGKSGNKI
ncbi:Hypothetical predicted protein [Octopus vulgaris]|uniref:Uncharacterized protein n=1 Tax=Octopus vulgaris TaxID=6645 RepID=A0AA36F006_OCTVU|nr:Hypothetical predicted protein [Octopus vulgaris]